MSKKSPKSDTKDPTAAKADAVIGAGVIAEATKGMPAGQKANVDKALSRAVEKAK